MGKLNWPPGNMLYPLPAVMVSVGNKDGETNIITIAWTGTICTNPPMLYISVRPERYSYDMIKESGEFVVNLTTKDLTIATDFCGVKSGRDVDKWAETGLTPGKAKELEFAPIIEESPVNIECKVENIVPLGSHHMFVAKVVNVQVSDEHLDENGKFHLNKTGLVAYSHGQYLETGPRLGKFGYSIQKKKSKDAIKGSKALKRVISDDLESRDSGEAGENEPSGPSTRKNKKSIKNRSNSKSKKSKVSKAKGNKSRKSKIAKNSKPKKSKKGKTGKNAK